jgi:hypothetical protein
MFPVLRLLEFCDPIGISSENHHASITEKPEEKDVDAKTAGDSYL